MTTKKPRIHSEEIKPLEPEAYVLAVFFFHFLLLLSFAYNAYTDYQKPQLNSIITIYQTE